MDFDGSSYIDVEHLNLTGAFSLSFWANYTTTGNGINIISQNQTSQATFGMYQLTDGKIRFWVTSSGSYNASNEITANTATNNGNWNNIILINDGTNLKIYINGSLDNSSSNGVSSPYNGTANFWIGGSQAGGAKFEGKLDSVSIYNYALSSSQITTLYGSSSIGIGNPMSLSPKPVSYYPLGDQDVYNGANYLVPNSSLKDYVFEIGNYPRLINTGTIADLNSNMAELSVSIWFKKTGGIRDYAILSKVGANNPTSFSLFWKRDSLATQGVNTAFKINNGSVQAVGGQFITGNAVPITIEENKWYNLVGTYNGTTQSLYINGVLHDFKSTTGNIVGVSGNALLGADSTASTYNWLGELSNSMIWTKGLSQSEVTTLYNNGSPIQTLASIPQNSNLKVWYKLDASATFDGTNWSIPDSSSNSNTGTSSGMTQSALQQSDLQHISGFSPYALQLDGTSNYIDCGNLQPSTTSLSISAWAYKTDTSNGSIIGRGASVDYGVFIYNGSLMFGLNSGSWSTIAISNFTNNYLNQWFHVCATWDGSTIKLYLNGNEEASASKTGTITYTSNNTTIGKNSTLSGFEWDGKLSNCSVWNTALTSSQVTEIYNEGVPSNLNNHSAYSNLVSWWQLGSNSSFNNTVWTVLDEKGTNDGVSSTNMSEVDIVNGVGYSSNGVSSGMSDNVIGDAPYSTANSLSVNMDVLDRTTDVPPTV